ncbi:MAG TPA: HEAT repeat domain-containing protein [Sandaracinaceae bacterium]
MRSAAFVLLLVLAPAIASAQQTQPPTRAEVRAMLSGIEDVPTDADFRRLGDAVLPILIELYADPNEAPFVRLRAVGAAGAFPREATRTFLLAVANAEGQSDLFVREAVLALARAFGPRAASDLRRFLSHPQPIVRESAARALGRVGTREAADALRARLPVERDAVVREAIQAAIQAALR